MLAGLKKRTASENNSQLWWIHHRTQCNLTSVIYNIRIHLDYSIINSLQDTRSPIFAEKICSSSFYHLKIKPSRLGCFAGVKRQLFSFGRNRPYSLHAKGIRKVRLSLMLVATLEHFICSHTSTRTNITPPGVSGALVGRVGIKHHQTMVLGAPSLIEMETAIHPPRMQFNNLLRCPWKQHIESLTWIWLQVLL